MFRPVGIVVACQAFSLLLSSWLGGLGRWLGLWRLRWLGWLSGLRGGLGGCLGWGSFFRGHNPWLLWGRTSGT